MIYGSVCSGIEAATAAWHPLGWRPTFFSEIEPFPCALLAHKYPDVPNYGDMTKFQEWPDAALDVLVGGTPCQAFSVAGLRQGLADPRGNLTLTYLAIASRYRPRWLVWENVPGVLSDSTGAFGALLGGLAELGYGWAYRVLDAQFFGVAQRRRRVFVVGCLGGWAAAVAVLFERESLRGDTAPRRGQGQRVARPIASCAPGGSGYRNDADTADNLVAHALRGEGFDASEDGTGRGIPLVPEVSPALKARDSKGPSSDGDGDGAPLIPNAFDARQSNVNQYGNMTGPLDTSGHSVAVAFDTTQITSAANYSNQKPGDPCHPLAAGAHPPALASTSAVRRLTPWECERLQGFPDDYTLIPVRGKPAADGPRYKALGNSMAVPVMHWIGRRIAMVDALAREVAA